jgi:hypothetical protein
MIRRGLWISGYVVLTFFAPNFTAAAQGPQLDSLRLTTSSRYLWRGLDLGKLALGADASFNIYGGLDKGAPQFFANAEFVRGFYDFRSRLTKSHARESVNLLYRLKTDTEARLWGGVGALQFPNRDREAKTTFEVAGGVATQIPWIQERRPVLSVDGARDFSHYGTGYVRAGIELDYEFGNRRTLFITPSQYWSGYDPEGSRVSRPLSPAGTEVMVRADFDSDPAKTRRVSRRLEPFLSALWSTRNADPNVFSIGLRVTFVF